MSEKIVTMKDFDLGSEMGQIANKEDARIYIEKANAKAALAIQAAKKAKKHSSTNRDVQDYVSKVREAIKKDQIPVEVYEEHFDGRLNALKDRKKKLLVKKDRQKGFLAKSDLKQLDDLTKAIEGVETEKAEWLKNYKKENNNEAKDTPAATVNNINN